MAASRGVRPIFKTKTFKDLRLNLLDAPKYEFDFVNMMEEAFWRVNSTRIS